MRILFGPSMERKISLAIVVSVLGVVCSAQGSLARGKSPAKSRPKPLTLSAVGALAEKFYSENEAIHATHSQPDLPETSLRASLKKCQVRPQRALSHESFSKFFGSRKFFTADSCKDESFAVISINRSRQVKLVALVPDVVRTIAPIWDEVGGNVRIRSKRDFQEYVSAWFYLRSLVEFPPEAIHVTEKLGTGTWAGTHYLIATADAGKGKGRRRKGGVRKGRAKKYTVTMGSKDKLTYTTASYSLDYW